MPDRSQVWAARHAEQGRLTTLRRQRRNVYATPGGDNEARAEELDVLIERSLLVIEDYGNALCERVDA